jgi:hypothetical protein
MASWIEVDTELPCANEVVEVWIKMSRAGAVMRLRGYRLAHRSGGGHSLWLNAITHQPFPEGWRVTKWRKMDPPSDAAWPPAPTLGTPKQA